MSKIFIASDHAGFELKGDIILFLKTLGNEIVDLGPFEINPTDDYPDYVKLVAEKILEEKGSLGVVIGGSGQGEAIEANRYRGVRAALWYGGDMDIVKLSKEHNNSNILSLGARFITAEDAKKALELWLNTPFSEEERHKRRIAKLDQL